MESNYYISSGGFILSSVAIIALSYFGYKSYKTVRGKLEEYFVSKVMESLKKDTDTQQNFKPHRGKSAIVSFNHHGKTHNIYVPYHRNKSTAMLRKKYYLIKGEEKILLEQKPGIPFLVSAQDLDGEKIIVCDKDDNILSQYEANIIPSI